MGKTILFLTENADKKEAIAAVCKKLRIELKEIRTGNINSPIGGFLGMPLNDKPMKMAPTLYQPPELMIFNGFGKTDLEVFLDQCKAADIEPTLYKGVITPYNITWSPYEFILKYEKEQKNRS